MQKTLDQLELIDERKGEKEGSGAKEAAKGKFLFHSRVISQELTSRTEQLFQTQNQSSTEILSDSKDLPEPKSHKKNDRLRSQTATGNHSQLQGCRDPD